MLSTLFQLLGGIGLFLIGMTLLTDGLTAFAGDSLRRALLRFTGTPFRAFASGTLVTLVVQSSTATTVTLIGFVSAGLLGFAQALGVVMGASLGTTGTGWLVATLGLKISLGFYTLPLIGLGAFLKLLGRGRWPALGMALAGFGMLFVGIDTMQTGMHGITDHFTLDMLGDDTIWHRLLTMFIGMVMTVILQSSTAMVATTLTALDAGAINFTQAATLVIGAAIGTTMTGVLAAIGGSILARRTALAHVLFNLSSGLIALAILPLLLWLIEAAQTHLHMQAGAVGLAAFHTLFIGIGVALFLPHAARFARLIERLLPDRDSSPASRLDDSQLQVPEVALSATHQALAQMAAELFAPIGAVCARHGGDSLAPALTPSRQQQMQQALDATQSFFARIPLDGANDRLADARLAQMHVIDHLLRLQARASAPLPLTMSNPPDILTQACDITAALLQLGMEGLAGQAADNWLSVMSQQADELTALRQQARSLIMHETASGYRTAAQALHILDGMRWLERVGHHAWRICHYLADAGAQQTLPTPTPSPTSTAATATADAGAVTPTATAATAPPSAFAAAVSLEPASATTSEAATATESIAESAPASAPTAASAPSPDAAPASTASAPAPSASSAEPASPARPQDAAPSSGNAASPSAHG